MERSLARALIWACSLVFCLNALPVAAKESPTPSSINEKFVDPRMDVKQMIETFEGESREIFVARDAIVQALQLKSGERVADIGAGTGLFSWMFADAVTATGKVYAVEISPKFVDHLRAESVKRGRKNVEVILSDQESTRLPKDSVDVTFICDTYHHFESPKETLSSIHQAMRDKGRLIVIDFERIAGVSPNWILDHVRGDKETFRKEIEAASFKFVREHKLEGLKENYFLEFERVPLIKS